MFNRRKTKKNATALEVGDVIVIAGERYEVTDSNYVPVYTTDRSTCHVVLRREQTSASSDSEILSLIIPKWFPMTIIKKK